MIQNEARAALPNVLHDQGIPNTIGGIGLSAARRRSAVPIPMFVGTMAGLLALLAILLGRAL